MDGGTVQLQYLRYSSLALALLGAGLQAPFLAAMLPDQFPDVGAHLPPPSLYSIGLGLSSIGLTIYPLSQRLSPAWCVLAFVPAIVPTFGTVMAVLVISQRAKEVHSKTLTIQKKDQSKA